MRGRNSSTVTSEPSRFQTEPSSRPIAPAPMTMSFFGGSVKLKCFGAADDCFAVKFRERQFHRRAAGGDDDIFRFDLLCLAIGGFDRNFSGRGDCAHAFEGR